MTKRFMALSVATILALTSNAQQEKVIKAATSISIGAEAAFPTGDLEKAGAKTGLGGSIKALFPVTKSGFITLSAGYIEFEGPRFLTYKVKYNVVPIKAGFRYQFQNAGGLYIEPQLGYASLTYKENSNSDSKGGFAWTPNIGILIKKRLDLSFRYESASIDGDKLTYAGARVAYNFNVGRR